MEMRSILLLLIRRWQWIAFAAALAGGTAFMVGRQLPATYVAEVDVVPMRARTEVTFDTRIKTLSTDSLAQSPAAQGASTLSAISAERRQSLARLVRNPDLERTVRESLGAGLPEHLRVPGRLLATVDSRLVPRSEIITITVQSQDPTVAEGVAKAWAQAYEQKVNLLYAAGASSGRTKLNDELLGARGAYDMAERFLSAFQGTSQLEEYTHLLESKREVLKSALKELTPARVQRLTDIHAASRRVDALLGDLMAFQRQLDLAPEDTVAASNAMALTFLKAQAFASSAPFPANLQVQLPGDVAGSTVQQQRADLAATGQALREWRTRLNEEYRVGLLELGVSEIVPPEQMRQSLQDVSPNGGAQESFSATVDEAPELQLSRALQDLEQAIRGLQGNVAEQSARQKNLLIERDIAWESYTSLLKKVEEARLSAAVGAGNEVSIASESVVAEAKPRNLLLMSTSATVLGAAVAGAWILLTGLVAPLVTRPDRQRVHSPAPAPSFVSNGLASE